MLLAVSVIIYLSLTLYIGYRASRKVRDSTDFAVAGRNLPFFMSSAALFATWFGSETILGASGEFIEHGLIGVIEEPIGAALCLILVGAFYARKIYRSNQLTFSDLFKRRFGPKTELISALVMIPSFFSWIAAQFLALGIIFQEVFGCSLPIGIVLAAILVVAYTSMGGMWAVSITDTVQMTVIIIGLMIILFILMGRMDGLSAFEQLPHDHFKLFNHEKMSVWHWLGAWITVGLGSIASQDVYQRVISAKNEKVAVQACITSGLLYLLIGFIPLFIGLIGSRLYPELYAQNSENFISVLIMDKTPEWIQIVFFGALVSAILSTASGVLLAPATVLAENILKPRFHHYNLLKMMRWSVFFMAIPSVFLAFNNQSIFELVGLASSFGLVSLFLPFTFTLFIKRTTSSSAVLGMILGLIGWSIAAIVGTDIPSIFYGLAASLSGIMAGVVLEKRIAS